MKAETAAAYNQGLRYAREGRITEAQGFLRQAIKSDPEYVEAHNVLGKVYLHLGDLRAAASHWERVLAIDATHPTARRCLKTLRRSNLLWTVRSLSRSIGVLVLVALTLFAAWQYQLPQQVSDLVVAVVELPGQLRAQPAIQTPVVASVRHPAISNAEIASPENRAPENSSLETAQNGTTLAEATPGMAEVRPALLEAKETTTESAATSPDPGIRSPEQLRVAYNKALARFRAGEIELAQSGFQAILDSGVTSSLLDNATYWLAEWYASQKRYAEALAGFARVERLPDGNKAHDARTRLRKIKRLMTVN